MGGCVMDKYYSPRRYQMMSMVRKSNQRPGTLGPALRAAIAGVIIFLLLVLVDQATLHFGLTRIQRFGDDLLGGLVVGLISFLAERRRKQYFDNRLQVIALMNHHVRNALQAIKFAQHTEHHVRVIDDAVARIEWALREVLAGEGSKV